MKYTVVVLTFISYAFMHALRTGYSFSKTYFKDQYNFSNVFLAVLDSIIYLALGIGLFSRYLFLSRHNMILTYFIASAIFSTAFALFPTFSILGVLTANNAALPSVILMFIFGFFEMHHWPVSLMLVNDYCTNEEDGMLIALWSSNGTAGNVFGFLFSSFLILNLHLPWQIPQIIMAFILVFAAALVFLLVERKNKQKTNEYLQLEGNKTQQISCTQMLNGLKQFVSTLDSSLLLISMCVYKSIIYTFLLWLPIYIASKGYSDQSVFISIVFNLSSVIGTGIVGKLYESKSGQQNKSYSCLLYVWPIMAFLVIIGLVILIMMKTYSPFIFALVIFVEGFATGSIFYLITTNQMIKLADGNEKLLDINTTIIFSVPSFTIGLSQLAVGLYMALQTNKEDQYRSVFIVMLGLASIGFIAILTRSWNIRKKVVQDQ